MPSVSKVGDRVKSVSKFLIVLIAVGCFAISGRAQDSQQPVTLDDAINGYQSVTNGHAGVPEDWSSHRLIFSQPVPGSDTYDKVMQDPHYWAQQIRRSSGTKTLTDGDADSWDGVGDTSDVSSLPDKKNKKTKKAKKTKKPTNGISKDWTQTLIAEGQVQPNAYPAKFQFFPATASCANDFVVFPTGVPGTGTTANIIGDNNLYTTGCTGTVPTLNWAYNTGAMVTTAPIISYDTTGSQVAFIQVTGTAASLVLLKWGANATGRTVTGTLSATTPNVTLTAGTFSATDVGAQISAPASIPGNDTISSIVDSTHANLATAPTTHATTQTLTIHAESLALPGAPPLFSLTTYRGCTAPCMTTVSLSANDTFSSPYYDIADDTIYVGDDSGRLHQITGVFTGTPTLNPAGSNFPVTLNATFKTTTPVYDGASGYVFVGNTGATLYAVGTGNSGTTSGSKHGTSSDLGDSIQDSPIVDSSAGMVYAFVNANAGGNNTVYQFPTSFTTGAGSSETVGVGGTATWLYDGTFDNVYYSSSDPPSGSLWVMGNTGTGGGNLYRIPIASNVMGTPVVAIADLTDNTAGHNPWPSPATEFCNNGASACTSNGTITTGGTDYIFFSVDRLNNALDSCGNASGNGCILSYSLIPAAATATTHGTTSLTATGGTITTADIGAGVSGSGIPAGDYILTVPNGTTATLAVAATTSVTNNALTLGPILTGNAQVTTVGSPGCWSTGGIIIDNASTLAGASQIYALELNGNGAGGPTHGLYTSATCTTGDAAAPIGFQSNQNNP
jgi:hypothetical protein